MMGRTGIRVCAGIVLAALTLAACDGDRGGGPTNERTPVASPTLGSGRVIGLVGTMSGSDAWRGTEAFEGADLGVARLNRTVPEGELPFELVTLDDEGDPARATELIEELAASDRTVGIIHAGASEALPPADDALADSGIPGVLLYGDLYSARLLRSHLFQMSPPYLWQARRVAAYLGRDRDYDRVGLVADRSFAGDAAVASVKAAVDDTAGLRVAVRRYRSAGDVASAVGHLRRSRVESIIFQGETRLLEELVRILAGRDALYRGTRAARWASLGAQQRNNKPRSVWRPQIVAFSEAMGETGTRFPAGTVATDTYARGVDYLPVPSFEAFSSAFEDWWATPPLGRELRAYEAVRMIGWAARRAEPGQDVALVLEELRGERFGGLDIVLGPDDHVVPEQTAIGLWVVPASEDLVRGPRRAEELPWVPLARGFSTDGSRTDIAAEDWRHLFRDPPPPDAPAPRVTRMKVGIATGRRDPLH